MHSRHGPHALLLALLTLAFATACTDDAADPPATAAPLPPSADRRHIVFDYSPTVSDAGALLYLATHPEVDLLAVTLPGTGEADCGSGVTATRALLAVAGRGDVPVACGRDQPLVGDRDWPEPWRNRHEGWGSLLPDVPSDEPALDAEGLLADTLTRAANPVTLVTVGPLTNVGAVLGSQPELSGKVAAVVVMGGAVRVAGNVEHAPTAEWNLYVDPEAVRRVLAADVAVLLVPLDATNALPWSERLAAQLSLIDTDAAHLMSGIIGLEASTEGLYLWDELAAMVAVTDGLVRVEPMALTVDEDGATEAAPTGDLVYVATSTDAAAARAEWLRVLAGGTYEPPVLTADELTYAVEMGGIATRTNERTSALWSQVPPEDPTVDDMIELATSFVDVVEELHAAVEAVSAPPELADLHEAYVESLGEVAAAFDDLVSEVRRTGAHDEAGLNAAAATVGIDDRFAAVDAACAALATPLLAANGPRPCG